MHPLGLGQKRSLEFISEELSPTRERAESLRSLGWIGEDHEAEASYEALSNVIHTMIGKRISSWVVYKDQSIDYVSSAKKFQSLKENNKVQELHLTELALLFFKFLQGTNLLHITACGLLYGFDRRVGCVFNGNLKPIEWAIFNKSFTVVDLIHKYGASLPHLGYQHFAASDRYIHRDFNAFVLNRPFNLKDLDNNKNTLLHFYAHFRNISEDDIHTAIAAGVDINAKNSEQQTALMVAVKIRNVPVVRELIYSEANVDLPDAQGCTPLMHSEAVEMTTLLLQESADAGIRNSAHQNALEYAATQTNRNPEIIRLLREALQLDRIV